VIDVWCVFAFDMDKSCMFVERATELLCETFPAMVSCFFCEEESYQNKPGCKGLWEYYTGR